jgi:hypothetical protein
MSRLFGVAVAAVAALSIVGVVIALGSSPGLKDAERVKEAIQWPSSCSRVSVRHPSRASVMQKWAPYTVQTADVLCEHTARFVDYARFRNTDARNLALAAGLPSQNLCVTKTEAVINHLSDVSSAVFADMCRTLGGTFSQPTR